LRVTKKKDPSELKPKGRKPSPKSTVIEVQSRVNKIFDLLVAGATRSQILQYAAKEDPDKNKRAWGVSDRMIDEYISKANALFSEQSKVVRDREVGKRVSRYNHIYTACMQAGDRRGALEAEKATANLLGLNAPTKLSHQDPDGKPLSPAVVVYVPDNGRKAGK